MSRIRLAVFGGIAPKFDATKLPPERAQVASNCKLGSGGLRAWRAESTENLPARTGALKTIHRYAKGTAYDRWLQWNEDVDVVPAPIAGDTTHRTYFTGTDMPRAFDVNTVDPGGGNSYYPEASYRLGIPAPTAPPTATVVGTGTGNPLSRAYVYTYVSAWGEEGPPSPPSAAVTVQTSQTVNLTTMAAAPVGAYQITKWRIYRIATTTTGAAYQFVAEININAATPQYNDAKTDLQLGEVLPSIEWDPPPTDLIGLIGLPNGIMAGFRGNELRLSEPYMPHAWPISYRQVVDQAIVGLGFFGTTIVIATAGYPYLLTGVHPSAMSLTKLPSLLPCVSKRGVVSTEMGVIYPSAAGLVMVNGGGATNVTDTMMSRDEWQARYPASLHACYFDGKYLGFYSRGLLNGLEDGAGLVFDPREPLATLTELPFYRYASYVEPTEDQPYLCDYDLVKNTITKWEGGGTKRSYQWKSPKVFTGGGKTFGAARVVGDYDSALSADELAAYNNLRNSQISANQSLLAAGDTRGGLNASQVNQYQINGNNFVAVLPEYADVPGVTFTLYADGAVAHTETVTSNEPFRLPGGYRAKHVEIELVGTVSVQQVDVATDMVELSQP